MELLLMAGGAVFVWIQWIEPNWLFLRRETFRPRRPLKTPLTVLHLSDLHLTKERLILRRFLGRLSRLDLDFVFVTGDLIDGPGGIAPCVEYLKAFKPKRGIYAVLGNHDYLIYPPFEQLIRMVTKKDFTAPRPKPEVEALQKSLAGAGIRLLKNEQIVVPLAAEEKMVLVGLDDPVTGRADLNRAFDAIPDGALRVALTHSPSTFPSLGWREVDVAFAGHTHGGQVRLPGIGPLPLAYRLAPIIDSTERFGFKGFVSRGLGAQPIASLRLFCRPEAVLVRIEGT